MQVFRAQCASCHTIDGYQGIRALLPEDAGHDRGCARHHAQQGETIAALPRTEPIDTSQLDYPFMPPFVGTEEEMQALAQYLASVAASSGPAVAERGGAH